MNLADRLIAASVGVESGCREWTRCVGRSGYARMSVQGRTTFAHRVSYETFVGAIPDGMDIDHLCRNRACILPAHLEPVTRAENLRRGLGGVRYVDTPINVGPVERTAEELVRIATAQWLLHPSRVVRQDVAAALEANGTPIALATLSLYRHGHMCPSDEKLAHLVRATAPLLYADANPRGRGGARKNAAKTHCPQGHPYDDENTRHYAGHRQCIACVNARNAARSGRAA